MCYNKSMERIEVLKGIEQILVQKAYETGHISHRADGDWQKTDNGWIRVKDSTAQSTGYTPTEDEEEAEARNVLGISPREKFPEDDEEYNEITEEDLVDPDIDDSAERAEYERQLIEEQNRRAEEDPTGYGYEEPPSSGEYGEITEQDFIDQDFESVPSSIKDKIFAIAQQYRSEWAEDGDEEVRQMANQDVEQIAQMLWHGADEDQRSDWVGKSAVRDMRSNLTTKNMGF